MTTPEPDDEKRPKHLHSDSESEAEQTMMFRPNFEDDPTDEPNQPARHRAEDS